MIADAVKFSIDKPNWMPIGVASAVVLVVIVIYLIWSKGKD